jgi:WD40 repeat protein
MSADQGGGERDALVASAPLVGEQLLPGVDLPAVPGSLPPIDAASAERYVAKPAPAPQALSSWQLDRPGAALQRPRGVWLSPARPLQEWCPVGRTLQVVEGPSAESGANILGCDVWSHSALSVTSNGRLRIWDLQTGECIQELGGGLSADRKHDRACRLFQRGTRAVSCGDDVRVWDVATGQQRGAPMTEHTKEVTCCDASHDGTKVLSGSADNTLKIWHLESTTEPVETLKGHTGAINCCVFFDNGRKVLSSSVDKSVRVWDLKDPNSSLELTGHSDTVASCDVCPGGDRVVSAGSSDYTVRLWNIVPTKKEKDLRVKITEQKDDKKRAQKLKTQLNKISSKRCLKIIRTDSKPTGCRVFPDGVRLLVIGASPQIYNLDTGQCLQKLLGHRSTINTCSVYDDGTKAITCGTKMRVWDLSSRGKPHQLGMPNQENMHASVVKELRVSPDGKQLLSCAYDDSLRIWDLATGTTIQKIGGGDGTHSGQVFDCSWFPDQERVLSCGGDGTLKIWSTSTGELLQTLKGHTKAVRGCWLFDGGAKALSCSKDKSLMVWDVATGQSTHTLLGHTDLIDRCCVFARDGTSYAMSASWDCTLRIWDTSTGEEVSVMRDHNKVRGFAVYQDCTRAVSTGSGLSLSIWNMDDLKAPSLITRLDTGHTATVWGLELLFDTLTSVVRCLTFSVDGTLRTWNLTEGEEREEVSGRRAFAPGPMCAAAIPAAGNYALGNAPIVVGLGKNPETELGDIKLVDLSNLGSGPSSSALALGLSCLELDAWTQWLLDAMDEDEQANVLFLRDDKSALPTLVHKLVAHADGATVLKEICKKYESESALGLVSHAGPSMSGNALAVAITQRHEDTAKVLLDDYSRHVEEATYELTGDHLLTEGDTVRMFEAFPGVATKFLQTVELCRTSGLVQEGSRCDFSALRYNELMRDHASSVPIPKGDVDKMWWDKKLDKLWEQSRSSFDKNEKSYITTRADDTAYGERVEAKVLPFTCAKAAVGATEGDAADTEQTRGKTTAHATRRAEEHTDTSAAATKVEATTVNMLGQKLKGAAKLSKAMIRLQSVSQKRLPFSRLLEKASSHADDHGPEIFESTVLRIIVQQKWEETCRQMHMILFYAYLIFLVVYAYCTLIFTEYIKSNDPTKIAIAWATWGYALLYVLLLAKREFHQMTAEWRSMETSNVCDKIFGTAVNYVCDLWNIMDLLNTGFTIWSLGLMAYGSRYDGSVHDGVLYDSIDFHTVRCLQALAGFGGGFKLLYFLRGMDFASFLINMLEHIIYGTPSLARIRPHSMLSDPFDSRDARPCWRRYD